MADDKATLEQRFKQNKEIGPEVTELGETGQAGLYRHPGSGQKLHTRYDPLLGDAQSEAAIRVGFVRVRDSKPEEIKELATASLQHEKDKKETSGESGTVKGIMARLNALEAENARLRSENPQGQTELNQSQAMAEADEQTAVRGTDNTGNLNPTAAQVGGTQTQVGESDENLGDTTAELQEKPLSKQNKTELLATAQAEGVENVSSETTNNELIGAIEAKRAEADAGSEEPEPAQEPNPAEEPAQEPATSEEGDK